MMHIKHSGLADLLDAYTLDAYSAGTDWQVAAKARAQAYIANHDGQWFCALGAVGSGKTHLCTAICGEFIKAGMSVRYAPWRDVSVKLKALVTDAAEYEAEISKYKNTNVLYIDDLFKGSTTPADVKLAYELLNARYIDRNLVTLISSELVLDELVKIDEGLGSRICERSGEYALEFVGAGKNQRLR